MYCPKCGKKLPKNATLCATCDQDKIKEYQEAQKEEAVVEEKAEEVKEEPAVEESVVKEEKIAEETTPEEATEEAATEEPVAEETTPVTEEKKEEVLTEEKKEEIKEETIQSTEVKPKKKRSLKWLKYVVLVIVLALVAVGGYIAYGKLVGFEKLNWKEGYKDNDLKVVTPNKVDLAFELSDESKYDDVKIKVTCGSFKQRRNKISWDLKEAQGKCKIEVKYKAKKISKTINVIDSYKEKEELSIKYEIDYDSDEDLDYDQLTNKEEKKYKTNPELSDTDADGLDDYYEINTSKTDPTKKDSDGDGLSDYDELELGLDPLKADSKGDGTKDGQRELTYDYETDNIKLSITGTGNIASLVADKNSNTKISGKKGIIDNLYVLYSDGNVKEAKLTITYTDEELTKYGLNEDNLAIYYYNEKEAKYEKVESTVDKENKTVTAILKHFSPYVVADSELIEEKTSSQVLFVLDNSWSMYTNEQYKEITGEEYTGGLFSSSTLKGNDADGVRFSLTSNLAEKLISKGNKVGLSEFRKDYANVLPIGSSNKDINTKLGKMNGSFVTKDAGTNTSNAIVKGLEEFADDSTEKYIIILTDGEDTVTSYTVNQVIDKANEKNVKICAIGFGEGSANTKLSNIANATGCRFYSSSDAMGLSELFDNVETELSDGLVDIDDDGNNDGIVIADSGFIVNRDGFSFSNFAATSSRGGHCFGMATVAELYYKKVLPLSAKEKTVGKETAHGYDLNGTYFKNYSNLYDFNLKTNILKNTFGYEIFGETEPKGYMVIKDNNLVYAKEYKDEINNSGIYDIDLNKSNLDAAGQKEKWGATYKKAEDAILNYEKMQGSSTLSKDEKQIINAIYYSFIKQDANSFFTSSSNFILWARNFFGTEDTAYTGKNGFLNILKSRLNDHDAPVISSTYSGGLHAINAISLIQDIANPNIYYIGVYDNNYPGEKRYVTIECNQKTCATKANSYYTESNQPIRITPSIEYDLEYYE